MYFHPDIMFSNWVICIFSYNRAALLQNLLNSIASLYPEMDVVVFDDGSNDADTIQLLQSLEGGDINVIIADRDHNVSKHGGLYAMMNTAISYAQTQGYRYAYFVQDDMQFLWRDEDLEHKVNNAFAKEECVMCNSSFLQKILTKGLEERLPKHNDEDLYSFHGNGVADTGIVDVEKARRIKLFFPEHSESGNGKYWFDKGFHLYWLPRPHLAWVPWPTTYRHKGVEKRKSKVLKPLPEQTIEKLKQNPAYAFLEDYSTVGVWPMKPYWYAASPGVFRLFKIYIKYYLQQIFR